MELATIDITIDLFCNKVYEYTDEKFNIIDNFVDKESDEYFFAIWDYKDNLKKYEYQTQAAVFHVNNLLDYSDYDEEYIERFIRLSVNDAIRQLNELSESLAEQKHFANTKLNEIDPQTSKKNMDVITKKKISNAGRKKHIANAIKIDQNIIAKLFLSLKEAGAIQDKPANQLAKDLENLTGYNHNNFEQKYLPLHNNLSIEQKNELLNILDRATTYAKNLTVKKDTPKI